MKNAYGKSKKKSKKVFKELNNFFFKKKLISPLNIKENVFFHKKRVFKKIVAIDLYSDHFSL